MSYSELIKNFGKIRAYMRSFYVYGFRHRDEFKQKSARGYDDERRRVESWLGDYMTFRQDAAGRCFFLSVDSRAIPHNPLYRAFRAKSFTDRDIMLHFQLMDILSGSDGIGLFDIQEQLAGRLNAFDVCEHPDDSTVRRKLTEYAKLGLVVCEKKGRGFVYRLRTETVKLERWRNALDFYAEAAPLGVIGDFCLDGLKEAPSPFRFKHHYILNALDAEILCALVQAIGERREVTLSRRKGRDRVLPLKLYVSTQTGRQYLLGRTAGKDGKFAFFRADSIDAVKIGDAVKVPEDIDEALSTFMGRVWGVSCADSASLKRIDMTVCAGPEEPFIPQRLEREKRCGAVEQIDGTHWRYTAEVYDPLEMLPWLRTFTGRVTALTCDDPEVTERFWGDLRSMAELYRGDEDALS